MGRSMGSQWVGQFSKWAIEWVGQFSKWAHQNKKMNFNDPILSTW